MKCSQNVPQGGSTYHTQPIHNVAHKDAQGHWHRTCFVREWLRTQARGWGNHVRPMKKRLPKKFRRVAGSEKNSQSSLFCSGELLQF